MLDGDRARSEETATWTRVVHWAALALAASLLVAGVLFALVEFGVVEGSGPPADAPNDYPIQLGFYFADQQVIFPYQIAGGLLFSLGFLAFALIGLGLRSLSGRPNPLGTIVAACFAFGAGLLVVSQLIFIGAKRVAIDTFLCDCRWATEQLISQDRALAMVESVNEWLIAGSLLLTGLGMLSLPALAARTPMLTAAWARASQMLGVVFFLGVLAILFEFDLAFELIAAVGSVLLLPAWAVWLDRRLAGPRQSSALC